MKIILFVLTVAVMSVAGCATEQDRITDPNSFNNKDYNDYANHPGAHDNTSPENDSGGHPNGNTPTSNSDSSGSGQNTPANNPSGR